MRRVGPRSKEIGTMMISIVCWKWPNPNPFGRQYGSDQVNLA